MELDFRVRVSMGGSNNKTEKKLSICSTSGWGGHSRVEQMSQSWQYIAANVTACADFWAMHAKKTAL